MITLTDLSFGYKRDEPIIADLNWTFPAGRVSGITGPSGRGKSTLLYLIGLLLSPWSGVIALDGSKLSSWGDLDKSRFRASRVGFVFQDAALDPTRTVLDNIIESSTYNDLPRSEAIGRAQRLMDRFDVGLRAGHKPGEVSGGQAQRIALCRALVSEPDIVLADEPTGNLDVDTAQMVISALVDLAHEEDRVVIIATHDPTIAEVCDQVLAL